MKKTIFFDLGNVILFFSHAKMCKQLADFCRLEEAAVKESLFEKGMGELYERGIIDSSMLHAHFSELSGQDLDFAGMMDAAGNIFEPNREIVSIIEQLKKNHIRLVLLSNTCEAHFKYAYKHFPQLHLFDHFVLSYEVGSLKPEAKIFHHALSVANNPVENCFYTDDIPAFIEGAKKCGLDAVQYTSTDKLTEELFKRGYL